uniref:IE1 n=2 Tax=Chrysodeixis includens nucleopolyhedrovirus TaxID=1207438 RepID=A0A1C8ZYW6_9ABAC|nr:IE1 [Chrysodeixis includens nucleopolyhedrovirus]
MSYPNNTINAVNMNNQEAYMNYTNNNEINTPTHPTHTYMENVPIEGYNNYDYSYNYNQQQHHQHQQQYYLQQQLQQQQHYHHQRQQHQQQQQPMSNNIEDDACDENSQFSECTDNQEQGTVNNISEMIKTANDVLENKNEYTNKHKTAVNMIKTSKKKTATKRTYSPSSTTKNKKTRPSRPPNSTIVAEDTIPPPPIKQTMINQTARVAESSLLNVGGKNLNLLKTNDESVASAASAVSAASVESDSYESDSDESDNEESENNVSAPPPPAKKLKLTIKSTKSSMKTTPQYDIQKKKPNNIGATIKTQKQEVKMNQHLNDDNKILQNVVDDQEQSKNHDLRTNDLFENKIIPNIMTMERDNNRKFVQYILNNHNYLFLVYENKYNANTFNVNPNTSIYKIEYVNCVQSIYKYYNANYSHIDRTCKVVSFNRFRFAISMKLLNKMQIELPPTEHFKKEDVKKISPKNTFCLLNEVKDPDFISRLTNTFGLDNIYIQGQLTMLLSSIGENRAKILNQQITTMIEDKSLFTIPLHLSRSKELEETVDDDINPNNTNVSSAYIRDIIQLSNSLNFKAPIIPLTSYNTKEQNIEVVLNCWINTQRANNDRDKDLAKSLQFTYKFTSVARVLFDENLNEVNKLFKVKKEPGSVAMIEDYLQACESVPDGNNFIMINTLNDERVTIIKAKTEFFWICSNNPNNLIHCNDIMMAFKKFNHHLLSLIPSNRKDLNNRHSGLIKLVAYHLGGEVDITFVRRMCDKFKCNYMYKKFKCINFKIMLYSIVIL